MASEVLDRKSYKIGEVCRIADVQPYVLRYWETEFPALAPNKSGGGQRLYSQQEVDLVLRIKQLLYTEGFTIAGAKKKLDSDEVLPDVTIAGGIALPELMDGKGEAIERLKRELRDLLKMLG
jgi:DNA-binding transcriptional MerR regulator